MGRRRGEEGLLGRALGAGLAGAEGWIGGSGGMLSNDAGEEGQGRVRRAF